MKSKVKGADPLMAKDESTGAYISNNFDDFARSISREIDEIYFKIMREMISGELNA